MPKNLLKKTKVALLIDDESGVRSVVSQMLEFKGIEVLLAENGAEGFKLFLMHQEIIDLVILDMSMPDYSGEDVLRRIREVSDEVAVLMSSGLFEHGSEQRLIALGCTGFLRKPFLPDTLFCALDDIAA